jgi:penicillin-binding protein 1A
MRVVAAIFLTLVVLAVAAAGGVLYGFYHYGKGLPKYDQLADYQPPVTTRVHAGDGRLMAEFAREKRIFVPVDAIPKRVIKAFLSAEDQRFYTHSGVDFVGVLRAVVTNLRNVGSNRRPIGASTITQQVAKNFLLTNEVSIARKAKEIILAFRIERAFSKDTILELYLNEIYLGAGSYGVAAAALTYFDKSLDDLSVGEAAFLAGLPKAPNNYHPLRRPEAARARRDYVLTRMAEDGYISRAEADAEIAKPVEARPKSRTVIARADYYTEEVRRRLVAQFGETRLYNGGLSVRTSLDPRLQQIAELSLRSGLSAYDRRHGWRGPLGKVDLSKDWVAALAKVPFPSDLSEWLPAVVTETGESSAMIVFGDGEEGLIPLAEMKWARPVDEKGNRGPAVKAPADILRPGDVVAVEKLPATEGQAEDNLYALRQIPAINGALVALDPHTGRVVALAGGFSADSSEFNRATQARRQPGSAFKPFVYLAALDNGFTPSSMILDAPFVIDQGPGLGPWRPANYSDKFYGPSPLRVGIEKSRNVMTVRLAQKIGMDTVSDYARKFGITEDLPQLLAMSLGAGETTLLKLTAAYGMLVNGGHAIEPTLIDKIQDRSGRNVLAYADYSCPECANVKPDALDVPVLSDLRAKVADPRTSYQVVSMLEGVVKRGTGRRIASLNRPLAGKTGTTNESRDTWFIGFSPDLAVGVFVGFDTPKPLGRHETGSSVAAPIFKSFMGDALKNEPPVPFRVPKGIQLVRVDQATGLPARGNSKSVILEAFLPGTIPTANGSVLGTDNEVYREEAPLPITGGVARPSLRDIIEGRATVSDPTSSGTVVVDPPPPSQSVENPVRRSQNLRDLY